MEMGWKRVTEQDCEANWRS